MEINKNTEEEECFLKEDTLEVRVQIREYFPPVLSNLKDDLPAKELHPVHRPEEMVARTFFTESSFEQLKDILSEHCIESVTSIQKSFLKISPMNTEEFSMSEIFSQLPYQIIYNKFSGYQTQTTSYTGRFKAIDVLADYNERMFKVLESYIESTYLETNVDQIDSNFENGNICKAYANSKRENEYHLLIEDDVNTHGYNNWFFFRLRTQKSGIRRFNIMNFVKKHSFYHENMLVSIFSMQEHKSKGTHWFKGGDNLTFQRTSFSRQTQSEEPYYCLSFEYNSVYDSDEIYFAFSQPYTYTRLANFLKEISSPTVKIIPVGYSIANNIIPLIKFTSENNKIEKPLIIFFARQHPCETVGSFIAEFLMRNLKESSIISKKLLEKFDVLMFPMINPDGVIHGTSRCNLSGLDLNRQWNSEALKELTPETVKIKNFINNLATKTKIKYFIDLHGHGKKLNSFLFACRSTEKESTRLLSMIMKKFEPRFDIYSCTYGITKDKEKTIRSQMHAMGVNHSYTLESSLYGWKSEENEIKHYNEEDFKKIAQTILNSLFCLEFDSNFVQEILEVTKESIQQEFSGLIPKLIREETKHVNDTEMMSESDPEGDGLKPQEMEHICANVNLRKRLTVSAIKFELNSKKEKSRKNNSTFRLQNKSIRENESLPISPIKLIEYKNENKEEKIAEPRAAKKMIEKWKEKRRFITEKMIHEAELKESKSKIGKEKLNYTTRKELHSQKKIKFLLTQEKLKSEGKSRNTNFDRKKRYKESSINYNDTQTKKYSQELIEEKSEDKIHLLKNESISMLLANTLTIFKATNSKKIINEDKKNERNNNRCYTEERTEKISLNNSKYHKFKRFLKHEVVEKKEIQKNSVFYYFPIL